MGSAVPTVFMREKRIRKMASVSMQTKCAQSRPLKPIILLSLSERMPPDGMDAWRDLAIRKILHD